MAEGTEPLFVNIRTNTPMSLSAIAAEIIALLVAGGLQCNTQTFLATDDYVPSTGLVFARVRVQAAGGGSGGADGVGGGGGVASGGGGGGEYREGIFTAAQIGSSQTVTIGAPGAAGTDTGGSGGDASNTSFGALIVAVGGFGGEGTGPDSVINDVRFGGAGGDGGSGGYLNVKGQDGSWSDFISDLATFAALRGGMGGNAHLGNGAIPDHGLINEDTTLALAGDDYGGGACGGNINSTSGIAGAAGGAAIVIVEEFILSL